ncbi:hypothetical protein QFZ80_000074 [Paenibacillus sp. V4I7]|nr:hypothetical protein [Paenibacillus sp. V4I7]MDQ0913826.1 hypothetical protein [Paenibacillus sp. V4I5]
MTPVYWEQIGNFILYMIIGVSILLFFGVPFCRWFINYVSK